MIMSSILHRSLTKSYPFAAGGETIYIVDKRGRRVLDGSSGAAVSCLGHSHPSVIEAIVKQAQELAFAHTSFFTNEPAEELASLLIDQSNGAFSNVIFLSSGSEAVESAIKLARHYHLCKGQASRVQIIARRFSYHGNTMGALAAGWNPQRREPYEALLSPTFHHVSPCFFSRDGEEGETALQYVDRLMSEFEALFEQLGPESVAAVLVEPVVGATLGSLPACKGYLARLRRLCDRYGSLLIFDEVMCGMGRTGTLHAWQSLDCVGPDIQTVGKGLAAGYQPLSAVLVSPKVSDVLHEHGSSSVFLSGHTYQAHAICCAAGLAVQKILVKDGLLDNVQRMGQYLVQALKFHIPSVLVKDVRGLGLFQTLEFTTTIGGPLAGQVAELTFEEGAAVYLCSKAVDAILFAPPFIISEPQVDELVQSFKKAVLRVAQSRGIKIN